MNLAFPVLLVFALILPGIIFRYTYARGSWGWASPTSMRRMADELAYGVAFAILLHLIWLGLVRLLGYNPDVEAALFLLVGNFGDKSTYLRSVLAEISQHVPEVAWYFLTLYATSAISGNGAHRFVRHFKLDLRWRPLRFDNYWYYMLTGEVLSFAENEESPRLVDGVYVSAVVEHKAESYLYRGIVADFTFTRDGELDTIVLTDAHRRALGADREPITEAAGAPGGKVDPDDRYYDIRGDYFILRYSEIRTLNLDYFAVTAESTPSESPTITLTSAFFCERVQSRGDAHDIIGYLDRILVNRFPYTAPELTFAVLLEAPKLEGQEHIIGIRATDEDFQTGLEPGEEQVRITDHVEGMPYRNVLQFPLRARFGHPGEFTIQVLANGRPIGESYIQVQQVTTPPPSLGDPSKGS